jgi:hypothetical protein
MCNHIREGEAEVLQEKGSVGLCEEAHRDSGWSAAAAIDRIYQVYGSRGLSVTNILDLMLKDWTTYRGLDHTPGSGSVPSVLLLLLLSEPSCRCLLVRL